MTANLTQVLNFKANFRKEFELSYITYNTAILI